MTDAEAATPVLWPPDVKNWLIWKDPDVGRDWRQEEKGTTENEMVERGRQRMRWLDGISDSRDMSLSKGVDDEQGSLACCSPWGRKGSDTTEWLNWTEWWYSGPRTVTCRYTYANKLPTLTQQVPPQRRVKSGPGTLQVKFMLIFHNRLRKLSWALYHTVFEEQKEPSIDSPGGSDSKKSACNARDLGSIPGSERAPGEGNGNPLQHSCLENPMDRGAWWATVHGITKSQTQLSN